MKNKSDYLYITSYKIVQNQNTIPYINYVISGRQLLSPIERRYSDFLAYRDKLLQNWPCYFIPGLPPKKAIGNLDSEYIEIRMSLLNRFLSFINNKKELLESKETKLFLLDDENFRAKLKELPNKSVIQIYDSYKTAYPDQVNLSEGKLLEYQRHITSSLMLLNNNKTVLTKLNSYLENQMQLELKQRKSTSDALDVLASLEKELTQGNLVFTKDDDFARFRSKHVRYIY